MRSYHSPHNFGLRLQVKNPPLPNPLRVEFLLKTDSGYPKDKGVIKPWQPLGIPSAITPIGQLHQSPPSPIPGELGRGPSHQSHVLVCFPRNLFFLGFLYFAQLHWGKRVSFLMGATLEYVYGGAKRLHLKMDEIDNGNFMD